MATEVVRHSPGELRILELHPGGGAYDILTVVHPHAGQLLHFNRAGSIHISATVDGVQPNSVYNTTWDRVLSESDPKAVVESLCGAARLPCKGTLPESTPPALVYRIISAFLAHATCGRILWECRNGFFDTSGEGGGPREEWFKQFPPAQKHRKVRLEDDFLGEAAYRFWFLLRDQKPVFCMETTGQGWDLKGSEFDLAKLYASKRKLWPIIAATLGDQLP